MCIHAKGFPGNSAGKESACNAGDPSLIPGSGRSSVEGIGYLFQYSWAYLVAQMVKNPPAMRKTWVKFLGWEDPLEKGMTIHSSILAGESPWTEEPAGLQSMGWQRVGHEWVTKHSTAHSTEHTKERHPSPQNRVTQITETLTLNTIFRYRRKKILAVVVWDFKGEEGNFHGDKRQL